MVNERVPTQFLLQGTYRAPVVHNTIILSVYFSLPDNYLSHTKLFYTPKSYHLYSTFHTHTPIYLTQRHPIQNQITSPPHKNCFIFTLTHLSIPKHNYIICILFTFRQLCISYQDQLASIATPQKALTVIVAGSNSPQMPLLPPYHHRRPTKRQSQHLSCDQHLHLPPHSRILLLVTRHHPYHHK